MEITIRVQIRLKDITDNFWHSFQLNCVSLRGSVMVCAGFEVEVVDGNYFEKIFVCFLCFS